jgi:hypothetical protein
LVQKREKLQLRYKKKQRGDKTPILSQILVQRKPGQVRAPTLLTELSSWDSLNGRREEEQLNLQPKHQNVAVIKEVKTQERKVLTRR